MKSTYHGHLLGHTCTNLSCIHLYRHTCISDRIRKIVPARFSPGFGQSPNPGPAGNSKPRGGGGGLRHGWIRQIAQSMGYLLVAQWGPSCQKQGGGEPANHKTWSQTLSLVYSSASAYDSIGLIFTTSYRSTLLIMTQTTTPSLEKTSLNLLHAEVILKKLY